MTEYFCLFYCAPVTFSLVLRASFGTSNPVKPAYSILHLAEVRQLCLLSKQWCVLCVNTTTLLSNNCTRQLDCFRCLAIAFNDSNGIRMRDFPLFRMGKDSFNAQLTGVRGKCLNQVVEFFRRICVCLPL